MISTQHTEINYETIAIPQKEAAAWKGTAKYGSRLIKEMVNTMRSSYFFLQSYTLKRLNSVSR